VAKEVSVVSEIFLVYLIYWHFI